MTKQEMAVKIEELQKIIIEKDKEIARLKGKNPRNAGRKSADKKWVASFNHFIELHESQKTINETIEEMGISRATYYRYKKLYNDTNIGLDN
jgi:response regulator of citrate/malate metabolism